MADRYVMHHKIWVLQMKNALKNKGFVIIIALLVLFIISIIVVRNYIIEVAVTSGASMEPTLIQGDHILINRLAYRSNKPAKGDIIAVKTGWLMIVKRVWGVPGDVIELKDNKLYCNNDMIEIGRIRSPYTGRPRSFGPLVVSDKHAFIIGDNKEHSIDSREFGMIKYDDIVGKVAMIYFPLKRVKRL